VRFHCPNPSLASSPRQKAQNYYAVPFLHLHHSSPPERHAIHRHCYTSATPLLLPTLPTLLPHHAIQRRHRRSRPIRRCEPPHRNLRVCLFSSHSAEQSLVNTRPRSPVPATHPSSPFTAAVLALKSTGKPILRSERQPRLPKVAGFEYICHLHPYTCRCSLGKHESVRPNRSMSAAVGSPLERLWLTRPPRCYLHLFYLSIALEVTALPLCPPYGNQC